MVIRHSRLRDEVFNFNCALVYSRLYSFLIHCRICIIILQIIRNINQRYISQCHILSAVDVSNFMRDRDGKVVIIFISILTNATDHIQCALHR